LAGKPAPDGFLEAARRLNVEPARAIVIEDAVAGVQAGRNGRFGFVIGVDRTGHAEELQHNGATLVTSDMTELIGLM
jgi:beta-phosphoglucomutase-like phosphatase (HAD superfamily)